jgi:hypothetical protein
MHQKFNKNVSSVGADFRNLAPVLIHQGRWLPVLASGESQAILTGSMRSGGHAMAQARQAGGIVDW